MFKINYSKLLILGSAKFVYSPTLHNTYNCKVTYIYLTSGKPNY